MFYEKKVSEFAWERLIPCCLVWDGVKLELELELELAGLGCSDFKEEEKGIINKFMGHYTPKVRNSIVAQKYFTLQQPLVLCKKNELTHLHYVKSNNKLWYPCFAHHIFMRCRNSI